MKDLGVRMVCNNHRNLRATGKMYWNRLAVLQQEVKGVLVEGTAGRISMENAEEEMTRLEEEINGIQECLEILEHLHKQTHCDLK